MKSLFPRVVLHCCMLALTMVFIACPSDNSNNPVGSTLSGFIVYDTPSASPAKVNIYDLSAQRERVAFQNGLVPAWTKDGTVLYHEPAPLFGSGSVKIKTMTSDGATQQTIFDTKLSSFGLALRPRMSSNGSHICFNHMYSSSSTPSPIYSGDATIVMSSSGSLTGAVAIDSLFDGSWAPDGTLVLSATSYYGFTERTLKPEGLYLYSPATNFITVISNTLSKPSFPAVSPDGKRIAFSMNKHIWVINMDGTALRQITTGSKEESYPCWSPDGKNIACISYGTFELTFYNAIAAVPADAAAPADLTNSSPYWLRDSQLNATTTSGRLNPYSSLSWK